MNEADQERHLDFTKVGKEELATKLAECIKYGI